MSYFVLLVCLLYLYVNLIGFFIVVVCNLVKNNMFNMQSLKMYKTLKKTIDSESKAINMRWIDDMDDSLLNVMLEEQNNGNRPNGTWTWYFVVIIIILISVYRILIGKPKC